MALLPFGQILDDIEAAPPTQESEFTADLSRRILRYQDRDGIRHALRAIAADDNYSFEQRFRALYALHIHLRRYKDLGQLSEVTSLYRDTFYRHPMWPFVESMTLFYCDQSPRDLRTAEKLARRALEQFPDHYFVLAHTAMVSARRLAREGVRRPREVNEAIHLANRALQLSNERYARFWGVLAELLIISGRFDEADDAISRAIELEDSSASDYAVRLSDYQMLRIDSQVSRHREALERSQAKAIKRLDQVRSETLGLLGLLAAVIAFLVTSVQLTTRLNFYDGSRLLIISGGVIVVVFSAYSITFQVGGLARKAAVALLGFAAIVGGLVL